MKLGRTDIFNLPRRTSIYRIQNAIEEIKKEFKHLEKMKRSQDRMDALEKKPKNKTAGRNRSGLTNGKNNGL